MVLVLSEADVESLIDVPSAVDAMEAAFKEAGRGRVFMPVRSRMSPPDSFGTLRLMPAALTETKTSGLKVLAGTAGHRRPGESYFITLLHDYDDGALRAIVSANRLTQLRTGAISAVATRALARRDARTFGLIGSGVQGRGQLEAVCSAVKFDKGMVYDISAESAAKLAEFGASKFGIRFSVAGSVDELLKKSDVISTSTTSTSPFLSAANVAGGTHVNAIGSNLPSRKELDKTLLRAAKVVVDSREQAVEESGDLEPVRKGELPPETIYAELSQVLSGTVPGRTDDAEITVFKSVGVALQDIAIADFIYRRAVKNGVGSELKL